MDEWAQVLSERIGHRFGTGTIKKLPGKTPEALIFLEPKKGFEPSTYALRVRCSTTELLRQYLFFNANYILNLSGAYVKKHLFFGRRRRLGTLPARCCSACRATGVRCCAERRTVSR